jgi:hypothetical protein
MKIVEKDTNRWRLIFRVQVESCVRQRQQEEHHFNTLPSRQDRRCFQWFSIGQVLGQLLLVARRITPGFVSFLRKAGSQNVHARSSGDQRVEYHHDSDRGQCQPGRGRQNTLVWRIDDDIGPHGRHVFLSHRVRYVSWRLRLWQSGVFF